MGIVHTVFQAALLYSLFIVPTFPAMPSVRLELAFCHLYLLWHFRSPEGGATCRQISSYTAIVSWILCGLLVTYGACLAILACIPRPPPIQGLEPELDVEVPVNAQARHVIHSSIDSYTRLVDSDVEKQLYTARPLPDTRDRQQQQKVQQGAPFTEYSTQYRPSTSSFRMLGRDENLPYRPAGESGRMRSLDESRPPPPSVPYAEPIPRAWTQTPGSMYSVSTSSVGFVSGARSATLPQPPPLAQFNPAQRIRSSSLSNSVYSVTAETQWSFHHLFPPWVHVG